MILLEYLMQGQYERKEEGLYDYRIILLIRIKQMQERHDKRRVKV